MLFEGKSPGVYVPETATPPTTVPEVTISRLLLIGKLPWTGPDEDSRTWSCSGWRDVVNRAQEYFEPSGSGQAIVRNLLENLRWQGATPVSSLRTELEGSVLKLLALPEGSAGEGDGSGSDGQQATPDSKSRRKAVSLTPTDPKVTAPVPQDPKSSLSSPRMPAPALGLIALTLSALKVYFEHGGGSVVVFHSESENELEDELNEDLLRKHDIGIICAPGRHRKLYEKLRTICGTRDSSPMGDAFCFLLIDAPRESDPTQVFAKGFGQEDHSSACFGPWLKDGAVELPASPAVAGVFAACDAAYGPYRAAAGLMFTIKGSWSLKQLLSDQSAGDLNEKGLNQLRLFGEGQRPVIWGARTLSDNIDLRYIPVARTLLALRKAIKLSLRSFVFHPNNRELRQWVYRLLYGYLEDRRRKGWLKGETADEAFVITFPTSVDDENKGILRVRVEVALARPAEFIEVEVIQMQQLAS